MKRIFSAGLVLLLSVSALSGCDVVRVGTRCKTGAAPGRTATHLVLCQKGRWTRSITLAETARAIVDLQRAAAVPTAIKVVSGDQQTVRADKPLAAPLVVEVTNKFGGAVSGAKVTFAEDSTNVPATTDVKGQAAFSGALTHRSTNTYTGVATATSSGGSVQTKFSFTVTAGSPKTVSFPYGCCHKPYSAYAEINTSFSSISVVVTDASGNGVPGMKVTFVPSTSSGGATMTPDVATVVSGAGGSAAITGAANGIDGCYDITATAVDPIDGTSATQTGSVCNLPVGATPGTYTPPA